MKGLPFFQGEMSEGQRGTKIVEGNFKPKTANKFHESIYPENHKFSPRQKMKHPNLRKVNTNGHFIRNVCFEMK